MHSLPKLKDRLLNQKLSRLEFLQREVFLSLLKSAGLSNSRGLSVSCGDGVWDYLAFKNIRGLTSIVATDIVPCPVKAADIQLLKSMGEWEFQQVSADCGLPFTNQYFDLVWHQDVLEHTEKPYHFLEEQYRVLRGGGVLIVGTPNLLRPANLLKISIGRLMFPLVIGSNKEIGEYVHVQEFHERQLILLLEEIGFTKVVVQHIYCGLNSLGINIKDYPTSNFGKTLCHFMMVKALKP